MRHQAILASLCGSALVLSLSTAIVSADSLSTSCVGVPATTSITWTASTVGGIAPIAFLWGNGVTTATQTADHTPGTYSMSIQATDASSTVATSTCMATVNPTPTATPTPTPTPTPTSTPTPTPTPTATPTPSPTPTPVSGSVAAQIQALLAQIEALKAQIVQLLLTSHIPVATSTPPVIPPPSTSCQDGIGRDIAQGHSGDDIKDLQKFLAKHPNLYPEGIVSGFYGPHTMQAVKRWQKMNGLPATGFFGTLSRSFWREHCDDDNKDDNDNKMMHASSTPFASTTMPWFMPSGQMKKMEKQGNHGDDHEDN